MSAPTPEAVSRLADQLREAAERASNGNLDTAERVTVGEIQCPLCGDGTIDHKTWTNIDEKPLGIEVFGIGGALVNYEAFARLANPDNILSLLAARSADQDRIAKLEERVLRLSEYAKAGADDYAAMCALLSAPENRDIIPKAVQDMAKTASLMSRAAAGDDVFAEYTAEFTRTRDSLEAAQDRIRELEGLLSALDTHLTISGDEFVMSGPAFALMKCRRGREMIKALHPHTKTED